MKLLEENIGNKLPDITLGYIFFRSDSNGNGNKNQNKWNCIKLKSFCTAKGTVNIMKRFILQSKEVIHSQLLEKQKIAEEKIKELEQKKSYLERSVKEAEDNIREMLMARRAQ